MLSWYLDKEGLEYILDFIKKNKIKSILEIGLGHGYSASKFAKVVDRVVSIEKSKWMIAKAEVPDNVEIIHDDALKVLDGIKEKFDLVFIDGSSNEYLDYFTKSLKIGKFIIADNVESHKERLSAFLEEIKKFNPCFIDTGKGLVVIKN